MSVETIDDIHFHTIATTASSGKSICFTHRGSQADDLYKQFGSDSTLIPLAIRSRNQRVLHQFTARLIDGINSLM